MIGGMRMIKKSQLGLSSTGFIYSLDSYAVPLLARSRVTRDRYSNDNNSERMK